MDSLNLHIAGVPLFLSSSLPLLPDPFPPEYQTFCTPLPDGKDDGFQLQLVPGIPREPTWGVLVSTAKPWRLFRDGAVRRLVWDGNDPRFPLWLMELVPGARSATVYCGPKLVVENGAGKAIKNPLHYPLDQLLMMYLLTGRGLGIVHSAGLLRGGKCIVAAGRSGAGKSTLARCWAACHGADALLSDDRMIIGCGEGGESPPKASGTPWPGELGAARNAEAPLGALVFLSKAKENQLLPVTPREALERLLPLTSIPWFDADVMPIALANLERCVEQVPLYEFRFTPDEEAVRTLAQLG